MTARPAQGRCSESCQGLSKLAIAFVPPVQTLAFPKAVCKFHTSLVIFTGWGFARGENDLEEDKEVYISGNN